MHREGLYTTRETNGFVMRNCRQQIWKYKNEEAAVKRRDDDITKIMFEKARDTQLELHHIDDTGLYMAYNVPIRNYLQTVC